MAYKGYCPIDSATDKIPVALYDNASSVHVTTVSDATYQIAADDYILSVTRTATGACAITLMTAEVISGRLITVKDAGLKASSNNITVDTEGAETIDGQDTAVLIEDGETAAFYSDGTNWFRMS